MDSIHEIQDWLSSHVASESDQMQDKAELSKNASPELPSDNIIATSDQEQKSAGVTLKEFTIFNNLPLELRQMVWKEVPIPKRVIILIISDPDSEFPKTIVRGPPPYAAFSICQDSRRCAILERQRGFSSKEEMERFPGHIQFNPDFDTL